MVSTVQTVCLTDRTVTPSLHSPHIFAISGRDITIYTVIRDVCTRFWLTLQVRGHRDLRIPTQPFIS